MDEAKNCLERTEESYKKGKDLLNKKEYSNAIDKYHDTVENALKTLLNLYGINYPPNHDILNFIPKIIEKIPKEDPNFYLYSEQILPPFIAIHNILKNIRNMVRYGFNGISSKRIFNEGLAKSISLMLETNYPLLKGWIIELMCKRKGI